MERIIHSTLLLLVVNLACGVHTVAAQDAPVATSELPAAGEIMLTGTVVRVDAGTLVISATQFTLPGSKSGPIKPAKDKTVVVTAKTFIHLRGKQEPTPLVGVAVAGATVNVTGLDAGSGKTLTAREVVVLSLPVDTAKPVDDRFAAAKGILAEAQDIAATITDAVAKAAALRGIAALQAKVGDTAASGTTVRAALRIVDALADANAKMGAQRDIAGVQFQAGDATGAGQTFALAKLSAQQLADANARPGALAGIATVQALAGDAAGSAQTFDLADQAMQQIPDAYRKACALADITGALARAGNMTAAQQAAGKINGAIGPSFAYQKSLALWGLAGSQARVRDIAGAQQTAGNVIDGYIKMRALLEIEIAQVDVGDMGGARQTTALLLDPYLKGVALAYLVSATAIAQAKAGDVAIARQTVLPITDLEHKTLAIASIAAAQAKAGDVVGAWKYAEQIFDPALTTSILSEMAVTLAQAGKLDMALQTVARIANSSGNVNALLRIADAIVPAAAPPASVGTAVAPAAAVVPVTANASAAAPVLQYGLYLHLGMPTFVPGANSREVGTLDPQRFAPTGLDDRGWARTAREAGMTFAVLTVKHESGFCLWDSKDYDYDVGSSAVKTDIVAQFVGACKAEGILPGVHYSIPDSHNEGDIRANGAVGALYFSLIKKQVTELHTNYPDIRVQLFDVANRLSAGQFHELCQLVKQLNPQCLVMLERTNASVDPDHEGAKLIYATDTVNRGWMWSQNSPLASPESLYQLYTHSRVKGQAYLLNVGIDTAGTIPPAYTQVLMGVKALIAQSGAGTGTATAASGATSAPTVQADPAERLKQLKDLLAKGLITKEVYDQKSKEIIDAL